MAGALALSVFIPSHAFNRGWQEYAIIVLIFTSVSSFIIGIQMRHKIRKWLGRKATDEDLASIETWIEVDEAEDKAEQKGPPST